MIHLSDRFTVRKLLRFTFPSIIMMVFTSIYGVVDGFFVSNFVGKEAFTAVNFVMPVIMILGGFGFMFGTGGGALISKTLGEGDRDRANRLFSMVIAVSAAIGVAIGVVGILFIRPITALLGAEGTLLDDCVLYARIVLIGVPAVFLQYEFQTLFSTAEQPKLGLWITVAAGVTNMVLDGLFVGVFGWGLVGAAVATTASQCVGGFLPFLFFCRRNGAGLLRLVRPMWSGKALVKVCTNGSSELMSNISSSIVSMIYNFQLLRYVGQDGISAYGVLMYVQFIFVAISIGYSIGSAPVVSFHYGALHYDELNSLLKKSVRLTAGAGMVLTALAYGLAQPLAKIFVGYDAGLLALTVHAFRLFCFSFLLSSFNIFASSFFTALNDGAVSAAISFLRTLIFQTSAVLLLPLLLETDGIWLSNTVAEVCAFAISVIFLFVKRKKYRYF